MGSSLKLTFQRDKNNLLKSVVPLSTESEPQNTLGVSALSEGIPVIVGEIDT